jgi:hypothetical protein
MSRSFALQWLFDDRRFNMSDVAKNLASFADEIAVESVNELSEAEIAQVSGGMEVQFDAFL